MFQKSKGCHNAGIIISLQEVIKRPLKDIVQVFLYFNGAFMDIQSLCQSTMSSSAQCLISDR